MNEENTQVTNHAMPNKPVDIVIDETKQKIIDIINRSGLPLSIVEYALKDIMTVINQEVSRQKQQYYMEEARRQQAAQQQSTPASSDVPAPDSKVDQTTQQ